MAKAGSVKGGYYTWVSTTFHSPAIFFIYMLGGPSNWFIFHQLLTLDKAWFLTQGIQLGKIQKTY